MFKENHVVVTGGAGALGQAVVSYFESRGARVAVLDYSDEILGEVFNSREPGNLYIACDLTSRKACEAAVKKIMSGKYDNY